MTTPDSVSALYDSLSRFVLLLNFIKYGDPYAAFTMHKPLHPKCGGTDGSNSRLSLTFLDDLILSTVHLPVEPTVLDAGCGFGGTIFRWHDRLGGHYDGLSLSRVQIGIASREARRRGIETECTFFRRSYDQPLKKKYDVILAIESLIHSQNLHRTVRNLAHALKPHGLLVVADDIMTNERCPSSDVDLLRFHWNLATPPAENTYARALADNNLVLTNDVDLTNYVQPRRRRQINTMLTLTLSLFRLLPVKPVRSIASAYIGGFALQRLYTRKMVQYKLLIARNG